MAALLLAACGDNLPGAPDAGPPDPPCGDNRDNDGDGKIDYPDDLGCDNLTDDTEDSLPKPQCSDNRDNDGDGLRDYPKDPGCLIPQSDDERDDCPDGPNCPACANEIDDDNNGMTDFPDDPGCQSAGDPIEFLDDPTACGPNLDIAPLPLTGMVSGTFDVADSLSQIPSPCGGGGGAPAFAYVLILHEPKIVVASTDNAGTTADTVLDLRSRMCADPGAHVACHDDVSPSSPVNRRSRLTASLQPGIYYIIVEGHDTTVTGDFTLTVQQFAGEGAACTMQSDCGPGLVCRIPVGGTMMICTDPVCSDGLDDDADGVIDYPDDPGCVAPTDDTEDDDCPTGPTCPDCGDQIDNDSDGQTDYPNDTSCTAASSTSESCNGEDDPIVPITTGTIMDTMVGASDDHDPSCGSNGGPDKLFTLDLPAMSTLVIDTENSAFDTLLSLMGAACTEPSIECDDDDGTSSGASRIQRANVPAGSYVVAVDAYSQLTTLGAFNVHVSGTIAPGGACEGALAQSGAIACGPGLMCLGPVGAKICSNECTDGVDNNGDGTFDYPNDPGCLSPNDSTEDTVCPGATCPACADGMDNDGDGQTDYPGDASCTAASGASETCNGEDDPILPITTGASTGTLVGASDDHNPSCGSDGGPDKLFTLDLPAMAQLTINTEGSAFDTLLSLMGAACTEPSIECDDDDGTSAGASLIQRTNVPAGSYVVAVDAYSSSTAVGAFNLNVAGTIAPNGSCEGALFQSGAIACGTGFMCAGPAGMKTCTNQCTDGIDNNGDGKADFPNDPGCQSPSDSTEDTVCPGATCPACSNLMDDDGDMLTDWPADFGCTSAAGTTELFCAAETEPVSAITMPVTTGTLAAPATDNYEQTCQGNTGNDVAYSLSAPVAATWVITTEGSTIGDSVLSVKDASCATAIACDDDGGTGFLSQISVFLPAGVYAIQVDSYTQTSNNGAFQLNVHGTAVAGSACTSPLFAAGVLACPTGQTCTAGVCQ